MSANLKKILVSGAALLMFASVGVSASNVSVSARHVRTHRVYRHHSRRNLHRYNVRRYNHKRNVHHYNVRKNAHHRNLKRYRHVKNVHKWNVHHNKRSRKSAKKSGVHSAVNTLPSSYFGNYYEGNYKPHYSDPNSFIHLAKYGSYMIGHTYPGQKSIAKHPLAKVKKLDTNMLTFNRALAAGKVAWDDYDYGAKYAVYFKGVQLPFALTKSGNKMIDHMNGTNSMQKVSPQQGNRLVHQNNNQHDPYFEN